MCVCVCVCVCVFITYIKKRLHKKWCMFMVVFCVGITFRSRFASPFLLQPYPAPHHYLEMHYNVNTFLMWLLQVLIDHLCACFPITNCMSFSSQTRVQCGGCSYEMLIFIIASFSWRLGAKSCLMNPKKIINRSACEYIVCMHFRRHVGVSVWLRKEKFIENKIVINAGVIHEGIFLQPWPVLVDSSNRKSQV